MTRPEPAGAGTAEMIAERLCPVCNRGPCGVRRVRRGRHITWTIPTACVQPIDDMHVGYWPADDTIRSSINPPGEEE